MSFASWKKEFYPITAARAAAQGAVGRSGAFAAEVGGYYCGKPQKTQGLF